MCLPLDPELFHLWPTVCVSLFVGFRRMLCRASQYGLLRSERPACLCYRQSVCMCALQYPCMYTIRSSSAIQKHYSSSDAAQVLHVSALNLIQGFGDPRSNIHNCNTHLIYQGSSLLADSRHTVCQCLTSQACGCADFELAVSLPDSSLVINNPKPENTL